MSTQARFALLLTAGLLTNAFAAESEQPRMYSSERPIETIATGLPLPSSVPGSMTLRPCEGCELVTLAVNSNARFIVNRQQVAFADLHRLVQSSSENVVVFYDVKTNAVTRIVVGDSN